MLFKFPRFTPIIVLAITALSCSKNTILSEKQNDWLQSQDSITVAIYPYHPPYQILSKDGDVKGIFSEYVELLEEKIGYTFNKKIYKTWPEVVEDIEKRKVDIIIEIHPTEKRNEYLNFYAFLFESPHVIVTRKNDANNNKISDLKNKTIILPKDYAIAEILAKENPEIQFASAINDLSSMQLLNSGKYDAYIGPKAVVHHMINTNDLQNLVIAGETKYNYKTGIALFKNNKELNGIIAKATASVSLKEKKDILDNWIFNIVTPFYEKTIFWVLFSGFILLVLIGIILINRYLKFKIRQKTKELIAAKNQAEESNRLKSAFIHNISHEVRTPMNGIIGFAELLNDPENTPEKRKEYSDIVIQSSQQLINIIDDIIEISRLQTNQVELNLEEVDINKVLKQLLAKFQNKANKKEITIHLNNKLTEEQSTILMDESKINKILDNLVDNAIKFTKKGLIEILSDVQNENMIVQIKDTGIGIRPEDQEIIFRNFSQSEKDASKSYDGLGLGLSIAQKNAELIKGSISFTSILNRGSSFMLKVPHHPVYDMSKNITSNDNHIVTKQKPIKQVVLIVEDGDVNFLFLKTLLLKMKNYKFVIHRAENGKEAVTICKENKNIDLVLMDIRMPIMNGYAATRKIKKLRPQLPIVAQTAYSTEEDVQKALEAGCDDFVSKPVDRRLLAPIINKYFSNISK